MSALWVFTAGVSAVAGVAVYRRLTPRHGSEGTAGAAVGRPPIVNRIEGEADSKGEEEEEEEGEEEVEGKAGDIEEEGEEDGEGDEDEEREGRGHRGRSLGSRRTSGDCVAMQAKRRMRRREAGNDGRLAIQTGEEAGGFREEGERERGKRDNSWEEEERRMSQGYADARLHAIAKKHSGHNGTSNPGVEAADVSDASVCALAFRGSGQGDDDEAKDDSDGQIAGDDARGVRCRSEEDQGLYENQHRFNQFQHYHADVHGHCLFTDDIDETAQLATLDDNCSDDFVLELGGTLNSGFTPPKPAPAPLAPDLHGLHAHRAQAGRQEVAGAAALLGVLRGLRRRLASWISEDKTDEGRDPGMVEVSAAEARSASRSRRRHGRETARATGGGGPPQGVQTAWDVHAVRAAPSHEVHRKRKQLLVLILVDGFCAAVREKRRGTRIRHKSP
ncbi:UNVERIFIED_CONTAM: hypothetical protein HHA_454010 [Hammondia hammondi]|eukprot:XP_008887404.1 hypothetical protein HHA_454010 [Hammondia hammondi]